MRYAKALAIIALLGVSIFGTTGCTTTTKTTDTKVTEKTPTGTVKIGDTAPDFDIRNQEQLKISLSEFKGKKNVVLVFYPADFTPV